MSAIDALKQKAIDWAKDVVKLYHTPVPKELEDEKAKLLKRAEKIKSGIEILIPGFTVFKDAGITTQLGAIPIVAGAVTISGIAGLIYYWNRDYAKFKTRDKEYKRLRSEGYDPNQASKIIDKIYNKNSFLDDIKSNIVTIGIIGVGAYFLIKYLPKRGG